VRPLGARKITVLRVRRGLKCLPRIVMVVPTVARMGDTKVMLGVVRLAAGAAGETSRAIAASASRRRVKLRRMARSSLSAGLAAP
jgi:hypothetical protein